MRHTHSSRQAFVGLLAAASLGLLAACGDDGADTSTNGPLLNGNNPTAKLSLACPGTVTAGVKIVNGFSASLGVADTFVGISPTPNMGDVFAPPSATTATFGGNTEANGIRTFGFTAPAAATNGTVYQLVAKSGSQTASCQVTVQTPSLNFTAPVNSSTASVCQNQRLRVSSTASDATIKVAGTVDLTASDGGLLTTSSTACTGSASLSGIGISGATGDFQNPVYLVSPTSTTSTVTATDTRDTTRTASVTVTFTDQVTSVNLDADLLAVNAAPSATRFSSLTATAYNASGRPVARQIVNFKIETKAGSDDRINPPAATTGTNGQATARYEAGSTPGTARVSACVTQTATDGSTNNVCDFRTITVRSAT